jgi:hypothetical protein
MKTLILALSASILIPAFTYAGDDVVPLEKISKGENLYRIVPRGTMIPNNRGGQANANSGYTGSYGRGGSRGGNVHFKPTQHYYMKDSTVSYRYAEERRNASRSYLGPNASYYNPDREALAPNVGIRNLAHVEPSRQPGVPMRSTKWRESNINNFEGDNYYRRVDATKYYHGGDIDPTGRSTGTTRMERVER